MTSQIKKLSNVQYIVTDEVLLRKWTEVISKRNKLLSLSDWTQLPDCNIPASIQRLWLKWRAKLRNIKKSTVIDPDKALSLLKNLENQMPEKLMETGSEPVMEVKDIVTVDKTDDLKEYVNNLINTTVLPKVISVDEITNIITQNSNNNLSIALNYIEKKIKELTPLVTLFQDVQEAKAQLNTLLNENVYKRYPQFNEELFQEAVDYLSGSTGDLPLLQLYATHNEIEMEMMANMMLDTKRKWIKDVCEIELFRLEHLNKIKQAGTIDELENIFKWISI